MTTPQTQSHDAISDLYHEAHKVTFDTLDNYCVTVTDRARELSENNDVSLIEARVHTFTALIIAMAEAYIYSFDDLPTKMVARRSLPALFAKYFAYPDTLTWISVKSFDLLMFPGHEEEFDKTLTKDQFDILQKLAVDGLREAAKDEAYRAKFDDEVFDHWASIAAGQPPYGYSIKE